MQRTTGISAPALAIALSLAAPVSAEAAMAWSTPTTACEVTFGADNLLRSNTLVMFQANRTGIIRLVCPITDARGIENPAVIPAFLGMTYRDSDGTGPNATVTVEVLRTRVLTGTVTVMSRLSSNSFSGTALQRGSTNYAPTFVQAERRFDFENHYYSVQITLQRANTTVEAAIAGVSIANLP